MNNIEFKHDGPIAIAMRNLIQGVRPSLERYSAELDSELNAKTRTPEEDRSLRAFTRRFMHRMYGIHVCRRGRVWLK